MPKVSCREGPHSPVPSGRGPCWRAAGGHEGYKEGSRQQVSCGLLCGRGIDWHPGPESLCLWVSDSLAFAMREAWRSDAAGGEERRWFAGPERRGKAGGGGQFAVWVSSGAFTGGYAGSWEGTASMFSLSSGQGLSILWCSGSGRAPGMVGAHLRSSTGSMLGAGPPSVD